MSLNHLARLLLLCLFVMMGRECRAEERTDQVFDPPAPFTANEFRKHAAYLASDELAGRAPGSEGSVKAGEYVVQQFKENGLKPLQQNGSWFQEFPLNLANSPKKETTAKNVLAVFPGRGNLKHEAIIVSAHYDHLGNKGDGSEGVDTIYNGADDNASGVSALLLVAKAIATRKIPLAESQRTVILAAFDAEEKGLLGARYYVQHPVWPLDKTAAIINFDGIGRLRMGKVFASDSETNPILAQAVRDAARKLRIVAETRFGGHGRSDHAVFLERSIPGVHFFTGANNDYHQVTDHWKRLNFEGGASIAWIGYEVLRKTMTHPDRIEFRKLNPTFDMTFVLNLVRSLGIVPMMNAQEGRYPQILYVVPKSPAEKNGLRSGDQITRVNGLQFERVEDALTVFQQANLEEGLRLSILRGGKNTKVNIPASFFEKMSGPKATLLKNGKYEVQFRYKAAPKVKAVYLAGEFNGWKTMAHRMNGPDKNGLFTTRLELAKGAYEYKFVIEGKDWKSDPQNLYRVGKYNNSILWAGTKRK